MQAFGCHFVVKLDAQETFLLGHPWIVLVCHLLFENTCVISEFIKFWLQKEAQHVDLMIGSYNTVLYKVIKYCKSLKI